MDRIEQSNYLDSIIWSGYPSVSLVHLHKIVNRLKTGEDYKVKLMNALIKNRLHIAERVGIIKLVMSGD